MASNSKNHSQLSGVIDIGSNAIRMMIGGNNSDGTVKKHIKIREPIRLGQDVFTEKVISIGNIEKTITAFNGFREYFEDYNVGNIRAVATSAVREADNKDDFIKAIKKKTGIKIDIIDFDEEAKLVFKAVHSAMDLSDQVFLLMDIGGGSVEFILGQGHKTIDSISFPLGTVRLLNELGDNADPESIRYDLKNILYPYLQKIEKFCFSHNHNVKAFIGTGGNLECIGQLRKTIFRKVSSTKIRYHELDFLVEELFTLSPKRRMAKYEFRPDRNDVILPASLVTQMIVRLLDVKQVHLPGVGLKEGALIDLLERL